MDFLKIKPHETFGTLSFVGKPINGGEVTRGSGANRKHVGTYCRLLSSRQSETIEVVFPPRLNLTNFKYGEVIEIEDVRAEPLSESTGNGSSISGWRLFAQNIKKVSA